MIRDLAPLVGRRLSFAVVPDWHGAWPLAAHLDYCRLVQENSAELLLHGYTHRRDRGWGPTTLLAEGCDEMNGLDLGATQRTLDRGQRDFTAVFGAPARGFVAPGWQRGHVRIDNGHAAGLDHVLGFFSLDTRDGRRLPLATFTWDVGRWGWLGHVGRALGSLRRSRGVPVLAIHPRDLRRGYWPAIVRFTRELLDAGHEPSTAAALLEAAC